MTSPSDRYEMIDRLLYLGNLDRYESQIKTDQDNVRSMNVVKQETSEGIMSGINTLVNRELGQ
jgi:hypothetical protein